MAFFPRDVGQFPRPKLWQPPLNDIRGQGIAGDAAGPGYVDPHHFPFQVNHGTAAVSRAKHRVMLQNGREAVTALTQGASEFLHQLRLLFVS